MSGESGSFGTSCFETPLASQELRLRAKLRYFFMNPCEKYNVKGRFPWKLSLQLLKIVLVTIQLAMFGDSRSKHVFFLEKSNLAFRHMYLKDWTPGYETMPYPPATGAYALYTIPEFYAHVDHVLHRYNLTEELAIGTYYFDDEKNDKPPVQLCNEHYKEGTIFSYNQSFVFDSHRIIRHNGQMLVNLDSDVKALHCAGSVIYDTGAESGIIAFYVAYDAFIIVISIFSLLLCIRSIFMAQKLRRETVVFFKQVYYKDLTMSDKMEFVNLWYVMIIFNDLITITASCLKIQIESQRYSHYEVCGVLLGTGNLMIWFGVLRYLKFFETYNLLILTMRKATPNVLRFLVCAGVFYFGFTVCGWIVLGPYHIKFRSITSASECLFSLVNGDEVFITFSVIDKGKAPTYIWWFSRIYLYSFVSLFIYAILNLFIAVILDTYEMIKFRTLASSSETLFSLLNGDDMYITFQAIRENRYDSYIWWFSKAYIYLCVAFFTYFVLNLFIGVILDAYETIKHYYEHGFPKTELHEFIDKDLDDEIFSMRPKANINCCSAAVSRACGAIINCCYTPRKRTHSVSDSMHHHVGAYQHYNDVDSDTDPLVQ